MGNLRILVWSSVARIINN
ncbi:hypothetical protein F383_27068 [Gossypium arboreum]|uniref:Uncharacterized protein n=1 Tax=Gossypium arboreum TaxID=29729 RepID=A0A0B0P738_GOSAR|nr:hypothetical protein F383_27068 [Gossypium arboreum]